MSSPQSASPQSLAAMLKSLRELSLQLEQRLEKASAASDSVPLQEDSTLRSQFIDRANDAVQALTNPYEYWMAVHGLSLDTAAFNCAFEFQIFNHIPPHGAAHARDLASATGVDEERLTRILRLLTLRDCLAEVAPDTFAHTEKTAWLRAHRPFAAFVRTSVDVFSKAATGLADALAAAPETGDDGQVKLTTAFEARFDDSFYNYWGRHPEKRDRFQFGLHEVRVLEEAAASYPWATLRGTVVDIGGGEGQVAVHLAQKYPQLEFVVQDTFINPNKIVELAATGLAARFRFEIHDYFTPQKEEQGAGNVCAYYLKHCLHNNDDADCVRILKAVVPALERATTTTPLIVAEFVLPEWDGRGGNKERSRRLLHHDVNMMALFNAKERTASQYQSLLTAADRRLKIVKVHNHAGVELSSVEVHLVKEA